MTRDTQRALAPPTVSVGEVEQEAAEHHAQFGRAVLGGVELRLHQIDKRRESVVPVHLLTPHVCKRMSARTVHGTN